MQKLLQFVLFALSIGVSIAYLEEVIKSIIDKKESNYIIAGFLSLLLVALWSLFYLVNLGPL